jgi:hypothetical protein
MTDCTYRHCADLHAMLEIVEGRRKQHLLYVRTAMDTATFVSGVGACSSLVREAKALEGVMVEWEVIGAAIKYTHMLESILRGGPPWLHWNDILDTAEERLQALRHTGVDADSGWCRGYCQWLSIRDRLRACMPLSEDETP